MYDHRSESGGEWEKFEEVACLIFSRVVLVFQNR